MAISKKDRMRTQRRKHRVGYAIRQSNQPRIAVFRSLKHIYAQIIDDANNATIVSCSTKELKDLSGDKKAQARLVGKELGKRAAAKGIEKAVFDRGSYRYHGRVKELAEGIRESNVQI